MFRSTQNTNSFFIRQSLLIKKKERPLPKSEWLNKKGHLSIRGNKFKGAHVHSIVKKKRLKNEKLDREYPEKWSDFSFEVVDKTLINLFAIS